MAEYVEREKVFEMLHSVDDGNIGSENWRAAIDAATTGLYNMPVADVQEVKHGYWEQIDPELCAICLKGETAWQCSVCKHKYAISGSGDVGFAYCPDCGAKMDEEENNVKANS